MFNCFQSKKKKFFSIVLDEKTASKVSLEAQIVIFFLDLLIAVYNKLTESMCIEDLGKTIKT